VTPTATAPDPAVFPDDVRRFAAERGVTEYLVPLYELAKRYFPGADVTVTFESDYEIPDLHWIVYEVTGGDVPDERDTYYRCIDEQVRMLPPAAREPFAMRVR
jgi:hypothetical protein